MFYEARSETRIRGNKAVARNTERKEFDGKLVARRGRARPIAYDKWPSMSAHPAPRERRLIDTSFA